MVNLLPNCKKLLFVLFSELKGNKLSKLYLEQDKAK